MGIELVADRIIEWLKGEGEVLDISLTSEEQVAEIRDYLDSRSINNYKTLREGQDNGAYVWQIRKIEDFSNA